MNSKGIIEKLKNKKVKRVFIQYPEGLKISIQDLYQRLEKAGIVAYLSGESCYGACDVRDEETKLLRCDALLHLGHTKFPNIETKLPVIYEEIRLKTNSVTTLKKSFGILKSYKKIGIYTTVQYLDSLENIRGYLELKGKEVFIIQSNKCKYPGQVMGCDQSTVKILDSKVDCHLFIGTGRFHPRGLLLATTKPFLFLDLESGKLENLTEERRKLDTKRIMAIQKARECENFGIIISTKPGQFLPNLAEQSKKILDKRKKKSFMIVFDEITPEKLLGLRLDCLVNCACPRLRDDSGLFKKPILNPEDLKEL